MKRKKTSSFLSLSLLCIGVIKIWETGGGLLYLLDGSRKTRTLARLVFFGSTKKLVVVGGEDIYIFLQLGKMRNEARSDADGQQMKSELILESWERWKKKKLTKKKKNKKILL